MGDACIRVLVVDDSAFYRKIVTDVLTGVQGIAVVGTAPNGRVAIDKLIELRPDVLTLDLSMPEMDGLALLRQLKTAGSRVGAVVLSSPASEGTETALTALSLGALDFVVKPAGPSVEDSIAGLRRELVPRILAFGRVQKVNRILEPRPLSAPPRLNAPVRPAGGRPQVVAIGISTGGPQALHAMMPLLPAGLDAPVVVVQHMPPGFTGTLAESLNRHCQLEVREGQDGQVLRKGCAYVAPGGRQMRIHYAAGVPTLRITDDPPENSCRPSVDYLFRSVAEVYGGNAVAVIMTGMGNDGAAGCRLIRQRGGMIIAQDAASCVVFGMPRQPVEEGTAQVVAPLDRIADEIVRALRAGALARR